MSSPAAPDTSPETTAASSPAPPPPSLFRDRNFLLLWAAQAISSLGDWALMIAIPVAVYDATGSRSALSLSFLAETLPPLLFGLVAGVFADRWDYRRTMITTDIGRACAVLLLLLGGSLSRLRPHDLALVYAVLFLASALSIFFTPARAALMASLLPRDRMMQANALSSSAMRLTALLGPALAAFLLFRLRPHGVFVFDAVTFLASAACVALVTHTPPPRPSAGRGAGALWADLTAGLRAFTERPALLYLISLLSVAAFAGGIINVLLYALVRDCLHVHGAAYGYLLSAVGLGALSAVPVIAGPLKGFHPPRLMAAGFALMALSGVVLSLAPTVSVAAPAFFVNGFGNMIMYLPVGALFGTEAPREVRGRVYASLGVLTAFLTATASLTGASLIGVPLRPLFVVLNLVFLPCGIAAWLLLDKRVARNA